MDSTSPLSPVTRLHGPSPAKPAQRPAATTEPAHVHHPVTPETSPPPVTANNPGTPLPIPPRLAKPPVMTRFSDELTKLLETAKGRSLTLGQALDMLRERGDAMFIILITIPFIIPLPAFGLSTPVGVAVGLMGICVFRGTRLWLPKKLRDREISYTSLERVTKAARWLISPVEKLMRPRWPLFFWPGMIHLIGIELMIAGGSLALPLPVIGTNFIFAIVILPLALGLLERDGLFVLIGHVIVLLEITAAVLLWYFGMQVIEPYLPAWMQ